MNEPCNNSQPPFAKTICSICYEDLKPTVEDLQAISICGHVFHELCIQQWFEYCSKGKKKCPICKQTCSAANVSRLYFQSAGDTNDSNLSQKLQTHIEDPKELRVEVSRLELKVNVLSSALESRENELKNISNEHFECQELLEKETSAKKEAMAQTHTFNRLLDLKTKDFDILKSKHNELQESNMALAKELAAVKLLYDLDLKEDEILKLASFGTGSHSKEDNVVIRKLNRLLFERNKSYQKLVETSKEHKTSKKQKNNEVLRNLNASKKKKDSPTVPNGVDPTFNDTCTPQDTMEPDIHLRKTKRSRVSENRDGVSSYFVLDDDAPKVSVPQPTKRATHDTSCSSKNVHETSEYNGHPGQDYTDDDVVFVYENVQDKPLLNIIKEASLPVPNSQEAGDSDFAAGLLAPDGSKRHPGSWCKRSQGSNASTQKSGYFVVKGPNGQGGTVSVLRSHSHSSHNSKGPSNSAKSGKFGTKASSSQSQGGLQIPHFFRKLGQQ